MERENHDDRRELGEDLLAHEGFLKRIAGRAGPDAQAPEDLAQETFLRALRSPPERDQPLRPWLARVLRNDMASRHRREALARILPFDDAADYTGRQTRSDHRDLDRAELVAIVREVVEEMREPYRTAIRLRYLEELSVGEIAERCGVPLETVRARLKRGLTDLRTRMERKHPRAPEWLVALLPWRWRRISKSHGMALGVPIAFLATAIGIVLTWLALLPDAPRPAVEPGASSAGVELARPGEFETRRLLLATDPPVTRSVSVRVVELPEGRPRADARVEHWIGEHLVTRARTDSEGRVRLELQTGSEGLLVAPRSSDATEARLLVPPEGTDFSLSVTRTTRVFGDVRDEHGVPQTGVQVVAVEARFPWIVDPLDDSLTPIDGIAPTWTDASGSFELEHVPVTAALWASDASRIASWGRPRSSAADLICFRQPARTPTDVLSADVACALVLREEYALTVLVEDERGAPVQNANLTMRGEGFTRRLRTTDAAGRATVSRLEGARAVSVLVEADGHGRSLHVPLELPLDSPTYRVVLEPARSIRGRVVDRAGQPVPGARVAAFARVAQGPPGAPSTREETATLPLCLAADAAPSACRTDDEGAFLVHGLSSGWFDLVVWRDREERQQFAARADGPAVELVWVQDASADSVLLDLRVVDGRDGGQLPEWQLLAFQPSTEGPGTSQRGRLIGSDPARLAMNANRDVRLSVGAPGYTSIECWREVGERALELELPLWPARALSVEVVDSDERPVRSGLVLARSLAPGAGEEAWCNAGGRLDPLGRVKLLGLPEDVPVELEIWHGASNVPHRATIPSDERAPRIQLLVALDGPRRPVRLTLPADLPPIASMKVRDAFGRVLVSWLAQGEQGHFMGTDTEGHRVVAFDSEGLMTFSGLQPEVGERLGPASGAGLPLLGLPAGRLRVDLRCADGAPHVAEVLVTEHGAPVLECPIVLDLGPGQAR